MQELPTLTLIKLQGDRLFTLESAQGCVGVVQVNLDLAQLFAAAPELLVMLEEVTNELAETYDLAWGTHTDPAPSAARPHVKAARALLARLGVQA